MIIINSSFSSISVCFYGPTKPWTYGHIWEVSSYFYS